MIFLDGMDGCFMASLEQSGKWVSVWLSVYPFAVWWVNGHCCDPGSLLID